MGLWLISTSGTVSTSEGELFSSVPEKFTRFSPAVSVSLPLSIMDDEMIWQAVRGGVRWYAL